MDRLLPTLIVVGVIGLSFAGMYFGWRALKKRQSGIPAPALLPPAGSVPLASLDCLYLNTTRSGRPFDRIAVHGLGLKDRAVVTVSEAGVGLYLKSRGSMFIPAEDLESIDTAAWTIDSGVEPGGLIRVTWRLGTELLDSYLRPDSEAAEWIGKANGIIPQSLLKAAE